MASIRFLVASALCMAVLASASVAKPKTPNQILDKIAEGAVAVMKEKNFIPLKKVQNGDIDVAIASDEGNRTEEFVLTSATISGLESFKRSKSGSFESGTAILKGTFKVEEVKISGTDNLDFPGVGQAEANTVEGEVVEDVKRMFCDVEINLTNLVPQSIKSWVCRNGFDTLEKATNMDGNLMASAHEEVMRAALRKIIQTTMETNVKVAVNNSIQRWKNAA